MARYRIGGLVIVALIIASTTLVNAGRKTVVRLHSVGAGTETTVWGVPGSVRADNRNDSTGNHDLIDHIGCQTWVSLESEDSDPEAGGTPTVTCTAQDPNDTYFCATNDAGFFKLAQLIDPDA